MSPHVARDLAIRLIAEHGLADWRFEFDRARRRFGLCDYTRRVISLSSALVRLNDEPHVRDTILHEIAHALTPGDGHGARWIAACEQLGAKPARTFCRADGVQLMAAPLRIGCLRCNWWADRHRVSWKAQICRYCRTPVCYRDQRTGWDYSIVRQDGLQRLLRVGPHDPHRRASIT